jgi:hypothetical protein
VIKRARAEETDTSLATDITIDRPGEKQKAKKMSGYNRSCGNVGDFPPTGNLATFCPGLNFSDLGSNEI